MTKILEIKDKIIKFVANYEIYAKMVAKFIVAFSLFFTINTCIGFMEKISNLPVALILALVCCLLPTGFTAVIAGVLVLLNLYTLSLEATMIALILLLIVYFLYFRFVPKDGVLGLLAPVCLKLNIANVLPMSAGLLRPIHSLLAMDCGIVLFYFMDGIRKSTSSLVGTNSGKVAVSTDKISVSIGQILSNKEMFLTLGVFTLAGVLVYLVRRLKIENAWLIAIISGALVQALGMIVGYIYLGMTGKIVWAVVGCIVAALVGMVLQFFFMNLDYSRTERVQFQDDEYYYYVTAIPKKYVASEEKTVKHFGTTASMGRRIDTSKAKTEKVDEKIAKKVIAQELDIDEDLL